jgi:hypothetical protein
VNDHDPIEPIPSALSALFTREAASYAEDPIAKAKVLHRVTRASAFALPTTAFDAAHAIAPAKIAATWTAAKVATLVAIAFVGGGAAGAAIVWSHASSNTAPSIAPMAVDRDNVRSKSDSAPIAPPSSSPPEVSPFDLPRVLPTTPQPSTSNASNANDRATGSLAREREVLDAARAALVHGQFEDALRGVRKHEANWPHGALEEEREALAVQALAASGQRAAAEQRAAHFRRAFPQSMLTEVVNAAISPPSP